MRGPELQTTNGVETDGGVVVGNKGDAPSPASFRSFEHPSTSARGTVHQSDAEVGETLSVCGKLNMKEINKARQRKTGATGLSYSARAAPEVADTTAQTSAGLHFPCVEELIHKYTVMIAEQKERALAAKRMQNQIREKQKQGDTEIHSSHQCRDFSSNSTKQKAVLLQQKYKSEIATKSREHVGERGPTRQVTSVCSDLSEGSGVSEHLQHRERVIDRVYDSTQQSDIYEGPTEHLTKRLQPYRNDPAENSAGLLQQKEFRDITKIHKEVDFMEHPIRCGCHSEHSTIHLRCSHGRVTKYLEQSENHLKDSTEHLKQRPVGQNMETHPQQEVKKGVVNIAQSQRWNSVTGEECRRQLVCQENNKEETDEFEQSSESLTSLFIKPSADVTRSISHVGGTTVSAMGDEGRHKLMLPRGSKRSVSPASDEGCSVVSPPESSLTPCSSEDDIVKSSVEKSSARWTWPPASNDQENELEGQVHRHEYGRCTSSDSAVCLLPSDDERRLQIKDPGFCLRQENADRKNLDFVASEDPFCDEAMVFDPRMNKESGIVFDFDNSQYIWRYGLSSKEPRKGSAIFPDSFSRQSSVDSSHNGDVWFEEMRNNTKEAAFDDGCDSTAGRDRLVASSGHSSWDLSSVEVKTGALSLDDDAHQVASPPDYGYPCRNRPKQFRKLTSMISCESGVVEDEDCSRKSSTTEGGENADEEEYLVELRRQSAQSFQTDDDESNANPQYRCWRTPSVVVSDYSDDVPCFTSVTLEELEQLKDAAYSDCASGSVSAVDTEHALRTPERKASDCSTCSTLSGDEDGNCDALLQPVRTTQKVGQQVCLVSAVFCMSFPLREIC
jgi:hypothetical protein